MKKTGLFIKKIDDKAKSKADELERWLRAKGIDVVKRETLPPGPRVPEKDMPSAPCDLSCVFALGGDGTFLSAVRWIGDQSIPILGIKFGEVGFLAEITEDSLFSAAEAILEGEFDTCLRMRLLVKVFRNGEEFARETVLNDVVINKGALARLAHMETYINDHYLTAYKADGLILSTPTGSTAYSLAAGGPIIHPAVPGIILTPICPFTLTNRPLIVPDSARIRIRLGEKSSNIMLTFDGQAGLEIDERDTIIVQKGPHPVQMITMPDQQYFDVLKAKLRWSGGRV
ncbi:NAD(+)/NADH kinase [Desulfococcaceae bacterium HSG8]|nr:NAD(+)/NADH kinase [Desulfococcaceae bacterium HSG8]